MSAQYFKVGHREPDYFLGLSPKSYSAPNGIRMCVECRVARYSELPVALNVYLSNPKPDCDIDATFPAAVPVARADIVRWLMSKRDHVIVGHCFDEDDRQITSHFTYFTLPRIREHWTQFESQPCPGCGRERYMAPRGLRYYARDEIAGVPWFTSDLGSTVVREDIVVGLKELGLARSAFWPVVLE